MSTPTPEQLAESDRQMWRAIGLSHRLKTLHEKMWNALVEEGKHIKVYAGDELIGEEDF
jgi:hypothetical protein